MQNIYAKYFIVITLFIMYSLIISTTVILKQFTIITSMERLVRKSFRFYLCFVK